ncbi:MAG: hypothetical protein ACREDR_22770, partial [Blastocatellia bacterium]
SPVASCDVRQVSKSQAASDIRHVSGSDPISTDANYSTFTRRTEWLECNFALLSLRFGVQTVVR